MIRFSLQNYLSLMVVLAGVHWFSPAQAEEALEWVRDPLVVEVQGCKTLCVGVYRKQHFKSFEVTTPRTDAAFVACDAVEDGTVCPGATDCKKNGLALNAAEAIETSLGALPKDASENHSWFGQPVVFSPHGCARKFCGGTDLQTGLGTKSEVLGYGSPLCDLSAASGQCPSAGRCASEATVGARLVRLSRVLEDGALVRVPAAANAQGPSEK